MSKIDTDADVEATFYPQEWTDSPGEVHDQGRKQLIPAPERDPVTFTVPRDEATTEDGNVFADESYEANRLQAHPAAPEWVNDWDGPYYVLTDGIEETN
jgi:hypothetical protein